METDLAESIIGSDLIPKPTALAVIDAYRAAGAERVTPQHFIPAAKLHRAKLSTVAAACGWGRCYQCNQWRDAGEQPSFDICDCPCVLVMKNIETCAAFWVYIFCGGPVLQTFSIPARLASPHAFPHE